MKARKSISVKVTGLGLAFLAMVVLSLVAAIDENNSLALLLGAFLLALFLVVMVQGALTIVPTRLIRLEIDNTFAGERVFVRGVLNSRFRVAEAPLEFVVASSAELETSRLRWVEATPRFALTLPSHQRGRLHLESLTLTCSHPLGLISWSVRFEELSVTGLIYPAPVDYLADPGPTTGEAGDGVVGDFDELQSWQSGEPLSGICWKTYAKTGKRMRRKFRDSDAGASWTDPIVTSLLAEPAYLDSDRLTALSDEEKRSQLCYWILEKQGRGEPFGLRFRGCLVETGIGPEHSDRCFELLAIG